jgi:hypothetical protein
MTTSRGASAVLLADDLQPDAFPLPDLDAGGLVTPVDDDLDLPDGRFLSGHCTGRGHGQSGRGEHDGDVSESGEQ